MMHVIDNTQTTLCPDEKWTWNKWLQFNKNSPLLSEILGMQTLQLILF